MIRNIMILIIIMIMVMIIVIVIIMIILITMTVKIATPNSQEIHLVMEFMSGGELYDRLFQEKVYKEELSDVKLWSLWGSREMGVGQTKTPNMEPRQMETRTKTCGPLVV